MSRSTNRVTYAALSALLYALNCRAEEVLPETWQDPKTNLTWVIHDSGKNMTHKAAEKYCTSLNIAEVAGWRLASIEELPLIYDISSTRTDEKHKNYHIAGGIVLKNSWVWSDSPSSATGYYAYQFSDKGKKFAAASGPISRMPALCVHD